MLNFDEFELDLARSPGKTISSIGAGGFSSVEKIRLGDRELARKRLNPHNDPAAHNQRVDRFWQEVEIVNSLRHPFIVKIIDSSEYRFDDSTEPLPYYIMELAEGTLSQTWKGFGGAQKWNQHSPFYLSLLYQAALAIAFLHSASTLHRDIKPDNLLVFDGNWLRISDFGSATALEPPMDNTRLTKTGFTLHTEGFAAPEQQSGLKNAVKQSDVFSFGATLFYLITGDTPTLNSEDNLNKLAHQAPPITEFLANCIRADFGERYVDGVEMLLEFRKMYLELISHHHYERLAFPPGLPALLEAHARVLHYQEPRLTPTLPEIFKNRGIELSSYCSAFNSRELDGLSKSSDLLPIFRSFRRLNERYRQTKAWADAENVAKLYRDLLSALQREGKLELTDSTTYEFAVELTSAVLSVSDRLNRFEGGREFLRFFCDTPHLPVEILQQVLAAQPGAQCFIARTVDRRWLRCAPEIEALLNGLD